MHVKEVPPLHFLFPAGHAIAIIFVLLFSLTDLASAQSPNLETHSQTTEQASSIQNTGNVAEIKDPEPEKRAISVSISVQSLDDLTGAVVSLVEQIKGNNGNAKGKFEKVLGIVVPVLAALLGAVLTFLATQYTEKRNWIRSQRNALWDRQIAAIASAARRIREVLSTVHVISTELTAISSGFNQTQVEKQANSMELERRQEQWSSHMVKAITSMDLTSVELRLLNVPNTLSSDIGDFLDHLKSILNAVRRSPEGDFERYCELMRTQVEELDASADKFVTSAREFHRGVYE